MKRFPWLVMAACVLAACGKSEVPAVPATASDATLYERVAVRLAGRTDLHKLGEAPPQMADVQWMVGRWDVEATVLAPPSMPESTEKGSSTVESVMKGCWLQMSDSYPAGTQDLGFFGYNPVTRQWIAVALDSAGNTVISRGAKWEGNKLVLEAPKVEIVGEQVTLRQTLTKVSADEYELLNEEQLPSGKWIALDRYHYRRAKG